MSCRNCNNDLTLTCGELLFAPCVVVEADLPDFSEYSDANCITLDQLIPEIYNEINDLRLDNVTLDCITIDGDFTHQKLEEAQNAEICSLKSQLEALSNCDFVDCLIEETNLNVQCLLGVDDCDNVITINTIGDLLQTLINKVCALESA